VSQDIACRKQTSCFFRRNHSKISKHG